MATSVHIASVHVYLHIMFDLLHRTAWTFKRLLQCNAGNALNQVLGLHYYQLSTFNNHYYRLLTIFNLDAENEGVKAFLVDFHVSPLELNKSLPSKSTFGIGCMYKQTQCNK